MPKLLRIIQSIPSIKAEPFKLWLAKVGSDRLDEIETIGHTPPPIQIVQKENNTQREILPIIV